MTWTQPNYKKDYKNFPWGLERESNEVNTYQGFCHRMPEKTISTQ